MVKTRSSDNSLLIEHHSVHAISLQLEDYTNNGIKRTRKCVIECDLTRDL